MFGSNMHENELQVAGEQLTWAHSSHMLQAVKRIRALQKTFVLMRTVRRQM